MVREYEIKRHVLAEGHYEILGWKEGNNTSGGLYVTTTGSHFDPRAELKILQGNEGQSASSKTVQGLLVAQSSSPRPPHFTINRFVDTEGAAVTPQDFSTLTVEPNHRYKWEIGLPQNAVPSTSIRDRMKAHMRSPSKQGSRPVEKHTFEWKKMSGGDNWMLADLTPTEEEAVATYMGVERRVGGLVDGKEWKLNVLAEHGRNFDVMVCLTLMTILWKRDGDFRYPAKSAK